MATKPNPGKASISWYLIVVLTIGVFGLGARWWEPQPPIEAVAFTDEFGEQQRIHTDAWAEHTFGYKGYWISDGGTANCWVEVNDEDTWHEGGQSGTEPDDIEWTNVLWGQWGGSWVEDNNNNNNSYGAGRGPSVTYRASNEYELWGVEVVQLDDEGGGGVPGRKDGPQAETNDNLSFHLFQIYGYDEMWYWGAVPGEVTLEGYAVQKIYQASLANADAWYEWYADGGVRIRNTAVSLDWTFSVLGTGISGVEVKTFDKSDGSIFVTYHEGPMESPVLQASKTINVHYPKRYTPVDLTNTAWVPDWINAWWDADGYDENKVDPDELHYYDVDYRRCKDPNLFWPKTVPGYASLGVHRLYDERDLPVPENYNFYEDFVNSNMHIVDGEPVYYGHSRWHGGDNWHVPMKEDTHPRVSRCTPDHSVFWLKVFAAPDEYYLSYPDPDPEPPYPYYRLKDPVQYASCVIGFGPANEGGAPAGYSQAYCHNQHIDCGRDF